jgi:hypothetical protein
MNKKTVATLDFFVAALEPDAEHPVLPAWGNRHVNAANLSDSYDIDYIERRELSEVPGISIIKCFINTRM